MTTPTMQGFKRKNLVLTFPEDSDFADLRIKSKRLDVDQLLEFATLRNLNPTNAESLADLKRITPVLADVFIEWNYQDDDDQPIPLTPAAVKKLDYEMAIACSRALVAAASGVSRPLPGLSGDGSRSLEESIPMETSSGAPES
jgi:hypothetical protein